MSPPCAACGGQTRPDQLRLYIRRDRSEAIVLCLECRSDYPHKRQYRPKKIPNSNRISLDQRGVDVDEWVGEQEGSA